MWPEDDDSEEDFDYHLDSHLTEEPIKPPENMKLTIEVGLSEYSPNGLLELIARGLLTQIGGEHKWKSLLEQHLLKLGKEKAEHLINETFEAIFHGSLAGVDFSSIVKDSADQFMNEKVDSSGNKSNYDRREQKTRKEWLASKIVQESMDEAFKLAEKEWKASTAQAIKETLTEALAVRLSKALPLPPELKG